MRGPLAVLLAVATLATAFLPLLAVTVGTESTGPSSPAVLDYGPHRMLPNPDVYPRAPFTEPAGWTGTPPRTRGSSQGPLVTGTANVIVILIEFTDVTATRTSGEIDTLMNDPTPAAPSARVFYEEVSYGVFRVQGTVTPWFQSAFPMSEYGADSSTSQFDDANGPIYRLVVDAVQRADATTNFANFDGDADGVVDHVIIVHAGDAQEANANNPDYIWSHRWSVVDANPGVPGNQALRADGVQIYGYIMVSELSPVGVFVHEFGHDLGLPDLYDTDGSSDGVGVWDVMGSGSWNGNPRGTTPAHFSAWGKVELGWIVPTVVTSPIFGAAIDDAETDPRAFKLPIRTTASGQEEYFLVENRQQVGFDAGLPAGGLLVWHIDDSQSSNMDDTHRWVDVEEADGNDRPTQPGDVWPNPLNADDFGPDSSPNSNSYLNQRTGWKVRNIGPPGDVMRADLSRDVDDDLMILRMDRPCCAPTGGTVTVTVRVANRGARTQTNIAANLTVYFDTFDAASVVCCGDKTIASLAQGATANLTWDIQAANAGKYILEASVALPLDEIPENNHMFGHFNAATYFLFDDVESGIGGWTRNGGAADEHRWEIAQDTANETASRSPTHAWRFGRQSGLIPLCPPICPPTFHTLTSPNVSVPGGPVYLYVWHRYDLRGRGIDLITGTVETDTAYVNVTINGVPRSLATFRDAQVDWQVFFVDLSPYVSGPATIALEFSASSDVLLDTGGWWVDDIAIANAPLTRGLVARAVNPTVTVEPLGVAIFRFKLANVGDFDDDVTFALQPPAGWVALLGQNESRMQPYDQFTARIRAGTDATLLLGFQVADAQRGTRYVVPVTAASAADPSVAVTFDTTTVIADPFGLAGLEKYVFLFLIVLAAVIVIAVVIDAVKKQKGVYRRW